MTADPIALIDGLEEVETIPAVRCDRCGTWGDPATHACPPRALPAAPAVVRYVAPVEADEPPPPRPRRARAGATANRHSPRLALLRDCAAIAEWDALARPRAASLVSGGRGGGAPRSSRPDWVDARHEHLAAAAALRDRLTALGARARAQRAADQRALDLLAALAALAALHPPRVAPPAAAARAPRLEATDLERGVAVLEWLVPRAKVLLEPMASAGTNAPVHRDLARAVAQAFTTPAQWAAWHPPPPAPPLHPDKRPAPPPPAPPAKLVQPRRPRPLAPDAPATPFARDHRAQLVARYPADRRAYEHARADRRPLALLRWLGWFVAHLRWEIRHVAWPDEQKAHAAAVARHRAAREAGATGVDRTGNELLALAARVWTGVLR